MEKQTIETVKDLSCKYLCPQESETESSNEDFPESFTRPVDEQIFSQFPEGALTNEMKTHIENAIDFMEQLHTAAANALKELKKTTPVIPHCPFRLLLQACVNWSLNSKVAASGKSREKHLKVTPSCAWYQAQQQA